MGSNGKAQREFIRREIAEAIEAARQAKAADSDHAPFFDLGILAVRVGEIALEEIAEMKTTVRTLVDDRHTLVIVKRCAWGLFGTSGLLGTVFLLIRVAVAVGGLTSGTAP